MLDYLLFIWLPFLFISLYFYLLLAFLPSFWTEVFLWLLFFVLILIFSIFHAYLLRRLDLNFVLIIYRRLGYAFFIKIVVLVSFWFRFGMYFDGFFINWDNLCYLFCNFLLLGWTEKPVMFNICDMVVFFLWFCFVFLHSIVDCLSDEFNCKP